MKTGYLRNIVAGLIGLSVLAACQERDAPESAVTMLTEKQLANATYEGIYDGSVTLKDGEYLGDPFAEGGASRPSVQLVDNFLVRETSTGMESMKQSCCL